VIGIHLREVFAIAAIAAIAAAAGAAQAQPSVAHVLEPATVNVDTLRQTPGPAWLRGASRHFIVYREQPVSAISLEATIDSLESAWVAATTLLDQRVRETPRAYVFVTSSRTRFAGVVAPQVKGLTMRLRSGDDLIVLVENDSVRAYSRHEVMHLVASRGWGRASRLWLAEGLATFADGRCQTSTTLAVGRDLLAARPMLRIQDIDENFLTMSLTERGTAYVFAGTLVDYLWSSRGRDGVRRLWMGRDSLIDVGVLAGLAGEETAAWRAYVARKAGVTPGLAPSAVQRAGCG
jgi:hypothetical protein